MTSRRDKLTTVRAAGLQLLPSLLLCDFANLRQEIQQLERAGIRALHLDVMDGVFVPNFTYGMTIVEAVRSVTDVLLDVHLMMQTPEEYLQQFYDAGADVLTFHIEAVAQPREVVDRIHELGAAAGVALNPTTPVEAMADVIPELDVALIMSVEAGFGGQAFQSQVLEKLTEIKSRTERDLVLEIDGGVGRETIGDCVRAGAEWLVAGSAIFGRADYARGIEELKQIMSANSDQEIA